MWIAAGFPVILCEKAGNYSSAVRYIEEHKANKPLN